MLYIFNGGSQVWGLSQASGQPRERLLIVLAETYSHGDAFLGC